MANEDGLDRTKADVVATYGVKVAEGLAGFIPIIGPAAVQLLSDLALPPDRLDRIMARLRRLKEKMDSQETRLAALEEAQQLVALAAEVKAEVDGPVSKERRERLAYVVSRGFSGDADDATIARMVVRALRDLEDAELILLAAFHPDYASDRTWVARHRRLIGPGYPQLTGGLGSNPDSQISEAGKANLLGRGLLARTGPVTACVIKVDGLPVPLRIEELAITPLGLNLLTNIGLLPKQKDEPAKTSDRPITDSSWTLGVTGASQGAD